MNIEWLKSITKEYPAWMAEITRIELDGGPYYASTNGKIAVAIRVDAAEPIEAVGDEKSQKKFAGVLTGDNFKTLDYAAFKEWVGPAVAIKRETCPQCYGKGQYDCHCENACCQGYVDPCDTCDGLKTVEMEREQKYALLDSVPVNRTILADAIPFLDAHEAEIGKAKKDAIIIRSSSWIMAFMPLDKCSEMMGTPFCTTVANEVQP
jgi:hypothetical protein